MTSREDVSSSEGIVATRLTIERRVDHDGYVHINVTADDDTSVSEMLGLLTWAQFEIWEQTTQERKAP